MKWKLCPFLLWVSMTWGWHCPDEAPNMNVRWIKSTGNMDVVAAGCLNGSQRSNGALYVVDITNGEDPEKIRFLMGVRHICCFDVLSSHDGEYPKVAVTYGDFRFSDKQNETCILDTANYSGGAYLLSKKYQYYIPVDSIDYDVLVPNHPDPDWDWDDNLFLGENFRTLADKNARSIDREAVKFFQQKKLDAALALLQTNAATLPLRSSTLPLFNDYGYFLEQANRSLEAIPVLEKVVAFAPERTPAYLNLGDAYAKAGETEKAKVNYQKYVDLMEKSGKGTKVPSRIRSFLKP